MPFYRRLADRTNRDRVGLQIVAACPETKEACASYLNGNGLKVDQIADISHSDLRINGTPTLILVSKNGAVQGDWIGQLSKPVEGEVERQALVAQR